MRIIYLKKIIDFSKKHAETTKSIAVWRSIVEKENWRNPKDIKISFPASKIINGKRARFKIVGNKYRIIIQVDFEDRLVEVRFIGTHSDYDAINANTI